MSALTVARAGSPARTSIRYWSAAPTGPPPGATFASALLASWEAITGRHRRARSATRCRSHRHAIAATWSAAIAPSDASENWVISRQEPSTSTTFGNTR